MRSNRSRAGRERVTLSQVKNVLRVRWLPALWPCVGIALIAAAPHYFSSGAVLQSLLFGVSLGVAGAVGSRRSSVAVMDEGLFVGGGYGGFFCRWSEIAVERRQFGPFSRDLLRLREPVRRYTRGNASGPPEFSWRPISSRRLYIRRYDTYWRTGPIGAAMTAHGVSLVAITPSPSPAVN